MDSVTDPVDRSFIGSVQVRYIVVCREGKMRCIAADTDTQLASLEAILVKLHSLCFDQEYISLFNPPWWE